MSTGHNAIFLSERGLAAVEKLIRRGVELWSPDSLPLLPGLWPRLAEFLRMPVHTIPVAVADATSPETPASQGIGLPSEGVHMHILPTLIYLLSASFSHLVQEDAQGKGPITKDRIEEILQFYGQQTDLNTRNLCEIVETLTP
ncbi:MAG: hypothetical protein ACOC8H_01600, partial [bacterium]